MPRTIQVTGHRGAAGLAPENTIAGFQLARELGCHAVELDVHLTADGHLAVIHDNDLDRTTNGTGPVAAHAAAELKTLYAGPGEPIPFLEEVLLMLRPTGMAVQIELKGPDTEVAAPQLVQSLGMTDRVRFTSFDHRQLVRARKDFPTISTGILVAPEETHPLLLGDAAKADSLHLEHSRIDRSIVAAAHAAGHLVAAFGRIDEEAVIDRLIQVPVDMIGSDRPDIVINRLRHFELYQGPG